MSVDELKNKKITLKEFKKLNAEEISYLTEHQIKCLSKKHIKSLTITQSNGLGIDHICAMSASQIQSLTIKQLRGFGSRVIGDLLFYRESDLTERQRDFLVNDAAYLQSLPTWKFQYLLPIKVKSLTLDQLKYLDYTQVDHLLFRHKKHMTPLQIKYINNKFFKE